MLRNDPYLSYADNLYSQFLQCQDEGRNVQQYEQAVKEIEAMDKNDCEREKKAIIRLELLEQCPIHKDAIYEEPSDLLDIKNARPKNRKNVERSSNVLNDEILYDKVYGAWLGRCSGCLLGIPVEGWKRERIEGFLKATLNYPLTNYMSSNISEDIRKKYDIIDNRQAYGSNLVPWINNIEYAPEDDDTNYTVIGLKLIETHGVDFTPDQVAETWLMNLPVYHLCTAERVAYKNLLNAVYPPDSAAFRNPYREWIGAQIRADFFGYITPGNPELSAEMAWRDASISHVKNGIYGEMFVAAMISAAAVMNDVNEIIAIGLSQIPEKSRLKEAIEKVITWQQEGITWEEAIERIHQIYDEYCRHHWCHTISNAMIVCAALLFGELDFERSIAISVMAAFDTDCNAATVGSIVGMILGAKALPDKWIAPLKDKLKSGVDGFGIVKISDMAKRTVDIIKTL